MAAPSLTLCLKMTLVPIKSSPDSQTIDESKYPSKLLVVIKRDLTISDLCRQIEENIESMGYHYLHISHISTQDMFRLSPKLILQDVVSNNSDLIGSYAIKYSHSNHNHNHSMKPIPIHSEITASNSSSSQSTTVTTNLSRDCNNTNNNNHDQYRSDPSTLKFLVQDWKRGTVHSMAQCYQIMKEYDLNTIQRAITNIKNDDNNLPQNQNHCISNSKAVDMDDVLLWTIFLCKCKLNNIELQSKTTEIAYSILITVIEKGEWTLSQKPTIEYLVQELITSDHLRDEQRCHLLNIGCDAERERSQQNEEQSQSQFVEDLNDSNNSRDCRWNENQHSNSMRMISIDPDAVISRVKNIGKIIKSVLHNALISGNSNSNATHILVSILTSSSTKELLGYKQVLQCCHQVITYHYRYSMKHRSVQGTDKYHQNMVNLKYIAENAITKLVTGLQRCLFGDKGHNDQEVHSFLDLMSNDKMPQHWRQFRVIITGIDIIWKHLGRIMSPSLNNRLSKNSTVMTRMRIHLLSVLFLLLEHWEINKESKLLFQHSHHSLLEEFVMKWIRETDDTVEFCQVISNKDIENVMAWPLSIQKAYFGKILLSPFLHQTYKSIGDALQIIKYVVKYPILLNEDGTDVQTKAEMADVNQIDFEFKKVYLQLIQKGLQEPSQKSKIIQQFSGVLLDRLRFATYSKEQVLLLRLLCLFQKNCKSQVQKDKIIRYVKDIYDDGKLANLTTQSYVDLLLQSDSTMSTRSVSKQDSFVRPDSRADTV